MRMHVLRIEDIARMFVLCRQFDKFRVSQLPKIYYNKKVS